MCAKAREIVRSLSSPCKLNHLAGLVTVKFGEGAKRVPILDAMCLADSPMLPSHCLCIASLQPAVYGIADVKHPTHLAFLTSLDCG